MAFGLLVKLSLVLVLMNVTVQGQHNVGRFSEEEIKQIVKLHNELRRSIHDAANMRELIWNEAVAMAASEWGTECEYVPRSDNQWGQNMNYFYGRDYHMPGLDMFSNSFTSWSNNTVNNEYRQYRFCGPDNPCSYSQLIAADVEQVGCSIVRCPRLQLKEPYGIQTHAKLLVCFYTPWVDVSTKDVYIPGERCSACPAETVCVDNLCSARFSGRPPHKFDSIGQAKVKIGLSSLSGKRRDDNQIKQQDSHAETNTHLERSSRVHNRHINNIIGSDNSRRPESSARKTSYVEYRRDPNSSSNVDVDKAVIYTPNNRVVPFPGKKEARDIRRIERFEKKLERRKKKDKKQKKRKRQNNQVELVQKQKEIVSESSETTHRNHTTLHSRKKRQTSYDDVLYLRRLEYQRYLRERREREMLERERRRQYEEDLRRRHEHRRRQMEMMELRRLSDNQRRLSDEQRRMQEDRERRRQRRLREQRRRQELMALLQSEGELTGEEQFNTISAHNILRRADGARELSWSSHLEKWAKYVIRCETEYPGPITCFTNFGKANGDQEIYNVVYDWAAEGNDLRRPLRYGCRTPYDQSMCNHNSIVRDKSLTQMACAAKNCGLERQLTCIYNSS